MAAAREKDRTKDWKDDTKKPEAKKPEPKKPANPLGDPDVISGIKRGEPMDRTAANEGHVNPDYGKLPGSTDNCQSCVVAFEARLRGYDVEANLRDRNNQKQTALAQDLTRAWIDPTTGKHPEALQNDQNKVRTSKQTERWLEDNVKQGERYNFAHGWKGTNGMSGHIVSVDRDSNGSLRIYDPQTGETHSGAGVKKYLSNVRMTYSIKTYWGSTLFPRGRLLRVDNLRLDDSFANAVLKGE